MTPQEAIPFIEALANGIDPATGAALPAETSLDNPQTIRALFLAVKALHAMSPWSSEEDDRLQCAFNTGVPLTEIALSHQRPVSAIRARLDQLAALEEIESEKKVVDAKCDNSLHIEGLCEICSGD